MDASTKFTVLLESGARASSTLKALAAGNKALVLYFYPKDNTPGCTLEGKEFSALQGDFAKRGVRVVGVSKDDADSHAQFVADCGLGIDLLSDPDGTLHDAFAAVGEKTLYGRKFVGTIRSTFVLGPDAKILKEWRNVRAAGHAAKVLEFVKSL